VTEPLDLAMLAELASVIESATESLAGYQYHQALDRTETFFWNFCDDYLELVKGRAYGTDQAAASAQAALSIALDVMLRLLAPFLPFVTEEVWSWWKEGSVHRAAWPRVDELADAAKADHGLLTTAASVLAEVRKAKSVEKRSLRTEVRRLVVEDTAEQLDALRAAETDLRQAGVVLDLELREADQRSVTVELVPANG